MREWIWLLSEKAIDIVLWKWDSVRQGVSLVTRVSVSVAAHEVRTKGP